MIQYIDKDAVVAEIEKKRDAALTRQRNLEAIGQVTVLNETLARELNRIISFINTLEVKEVDLEKEIQDIHKHFHDYYGIVDSNTGEFAKVENMVQLARHFFELGIQQSKKRQ